MATMPPCPTCRTNQRVQPHGRTYFYCKLCRGFFDDDPDEGGTYSDRNPAVRLEREERRTARQQQRRRF
jgi:hypothetical protein